MDILLLAIVASLLVFLIVLITWYSRQTSNKGKTAVGGPAARGAGSRRVGAVRGVRQRRGRVAVEGSAGDEQEHQDEGNEAEREDDRTDELAEQSKLGAKKRAKLEAKAERKAQREIDARDREERKKREQRLQEQRDKESEREKEEERRREEAEKALREEKERREQEEYLKLKQAFSVDEEGFEDKFEGRSEEEHKNTFAEILAYAKRAKVVVLEDLAREFGINTMVIINWIQQMLADGILTGVIDDRGKFIYVSQKEFDAVAKFIKQRGRISIAELAEHTSQLINLQPVGNLGTVAE